VHGAAGAVGSMVTQLAREAGAYVIGTGRALPTVRKALDFRARQGFRRPRQRRPRRRRRSRSGVRCHRRRHRESGPQGLIRAGGNTGDHRRADRGAARRRPGDRLCSRVRSRPNWVRSSSGWRDGTTADEHRQHRDPGRCRRRFQSDRAHQREDDHPRSSVSDTRPSMHAVGRRCPDRPAASYQPRRGQPGKLPMAPGIRCRTSFFIAGNISSKETNNRGDNSHEGDRGKRTRPAGTAGMTLVERPEPQAAIKRRRRSGPCVGIRPD